MTQPAHDSATRPDPDTGHAHIDALRSSVDRLRAVAAPLTEPQLDGSAYPAEWTVAQVLSHLGSGAAIMQRRLEDSLAGQDTPDDFAPDVWDAWNAKTPLAQRDEALVADAALLNRIEAVSPEERDRFAFTMGPVALGFTEFVGMRLNEHALHTWDVEVVSDANAILPQEVAGLVVDSLDLIARFTGRPTGETTNIMVSTTDPERGFIVDLTPDSATLSAGAATPSADVELSAEAFARLVYGRLDPEHTPPGNHGPALETLRKVFPGP